MLAEARFLVTRKWPTLLTWEMFPDIVPSKGNFGGRTES